MTLQTKCAYQAIRYRGMSHKEQSNWKGVVKGTGKMGALVMYPVAGRECTGLLTFAVRLFFLMIYYPQETEVQRVR